MIRSLPGADFFVIDLSVLKKGCVRLAVLVIRKAVHEKPGLQIKSTPVFRIACELVGIQQRNQSLTLLPPFHIFISRRF